MAAGYAQFLPEAEQLPAERVFPLRQDVNLLFANVQTGIAAVLPHLARLKVELPMMKVERFGELTALTGALLHATTQASVVPMKREQMNQKVTRLQELREPLLLCAEAFALLGLLPKRRVEQIRSGKGPFDAAQDGAALADLYTEFAPVLRNKHPFTDAQLAEVGEIGHALLRVITPEGARTTPSPELMAAMEIRDRLYSLLLERHADLRRAGFYLYGEEVDQKVPILGARKGRSRSEAEPPEPLPVPLTPQPAPAAPPMN